MACKQTWPKLYVYVPPVKNDFCIFKWLKENQKKKHVLGHLKLYEIQISVSIHKILLEHSHTYLFTCCVCLLPHFNGSRNHMVKYLLSGP